MTIIPLSAALIGTIALSGCSAIRSGKADGLALSDVKLDGRAPIAQMAVAQSRFSVTTVDVALSPSLRVSEANRFYPDADIVWRGEPMGDRLAQVQSILEEGLSVGTAGLNSGPPATLNVQLERFHALTEKARFSVGGVHDIIVVLTVFDPETGAVLEGPRRVEVAIRASGNNAAIAEDAAGRTQRVVIVEGLAEAMRRELTGPLVLGRSGKRGLFGGFRKS